MTFDQWQEVDRLYHSLADLSRSEWLPVLEQVPDVEVREEVLGLLDAGAAQPPPVLAGAFARAIRSVASAATAPKQRFGPWRVTRVIGYGGMGAVYEAVRDDQAFDKKVAIKVLQIGRDNPIARERFRQERAILATLNHPNIAHLIDGGETAEDVSYIVMEYVDGEPVTAWCARNRPSTEQILRLFLQICAGMEYAHQRLIVHRDLKPANILVTAEGVPKLLDFGIAKLLDQGVTLTRTGWQAMTPAYASPEQIMGQPVTTATDVYSLGMVLYEMLTGRAPYKLPTTSSPAAIAQTVCETAPEPPRITSDLDNILLMALRKEPERRYPSVAAFAADVENFLAHRVVMAREDTLWYRTSRYLQRNRLPVFAAIALVITLAGGIVASQLQARRAQQRFDSVRGLANEVLFRVDARLSEIPGTTEARQELVRTVLRHLEKLVGDTGGDAGLESELAAAYHRAGTLQASLTGAGDSRDSFRKAIELGERVRRSGKASSQTIYVLCQSYHWLGTRSYDIGDLHETRRSLMLAIERARDPQAGTGFPGVIAVASKWMGRMELDGGRAADGVRWMEEAVRAAEQDVQRNRTIPTVAEWISAQLYLGRAVVLLGDLKRAAELSHKAAQEATEMYRANPGNSLVRFAYIEGLLGAGEGYTMASDMSRHIVPLPTVEKAVLFAQSQYEENPTSRHWLTWLITAYLQQSFAATDPRVAEAAARKSLAMAERQLQEAAIPSTITVRNRAGVRIQLADCLRRNGDRVGAVEQATLATREMEEHFKDREAKAVVLRATLVLAALHLDAGDRVRAAERFEAARKLAEPLFTSDNTDLRIGAFLATSLEGLAKCAKEASRAGQLLNQSSEIWKRWPKNVEYAQQHLHAVDALLAVSRGSN